MTDAKVICPGCDRKFNSIETMTNHGRSIHWWGEKSIEAMKREHNKENNPMDNQAKDNLENATARPWSYEYDNDTGSNDEYYREFFNVLDSNGNTVCEAREEPNAALIASAPELLEALKELISLCPDLHWAKLKQYEQVIAKAEGRS